MKSGVVRGVVQCQVHKVCRLFMTDRDQVFSSPVKMLNKNKRLLQLLAIVSVLCFFVIMLTTDRKLQKRGE